MHLWPRRNRMVRSPILCTFCKHAMDIHRHAASVLRAQGLMAKLSTEEDLAKRSDGFCVAVPRRDIDGSLAGIPGGDSLIHNTTKAQVLFRPHGRGVRA
jgi:hypothetical protein